MTTEFLNRIDTQIQAKHLLNHPFYQAWTRGELSLECLKEYAMEYYHHVKAFPCYLSAVHTHTQNAGARKHLLNNLIEEEAGSPNHPDLWRSFAKSLGATDEEIDAHQPSMAIQDVVNTFMDICRNQETAAGIAALYAYESQIPPICISKIKGLRQHYGMQNPEDWKYFTVHIEADKEHAAVERELLSHYVTKSNETTVTHSVERTLDALWNFLSSLCERYNLCPTNM
jgi:pyrroloquinoline-quinone synthase